MGPDERRLAVSNLIKEMKTKNYSVTDEQIIAAAMKKFNNVVKIQVIDIVRELSY